MRDSLVEKSYRLAIAEHVRCRQFDDELVLVDLVGGEYFALDEVGMRMWCEMLSGKTPTEVAVCLAREYAASEAQISRDCAALVDELLRRRLLVRSSP
jgi:hypothetical protein